MKPTDKTEIEKELRELLKPLDRAIYEASRKGEYSIRFPTSQIQETIDGHFLLKTGLCLETSLSEVLRTMDEKTVAELLKGILESCGYEVSEPTDTFYLLWVKAKEPKSSLVVDARKAMDAAERYRKKRSNELDKLIGMLDFLKDSGVELSSQFSKSLKEEVVSEVSFDQQLRM